jgi:hypothetical protein
MASRGGGEILLDPFPLGDAQAAFAVQAVLSALYSPFSKYLRSVTMPICLK